MSAEEDRLEVRTGFGSVKATGNLIVLLIVILMAFLGIAYMLYMHDRGGVDRYNILVKEVIEMRDSINEQTYVSTLTDEKKHALNMDMPDSLRRKLGR